MPLNEEDWFRYDDYESMLSWIGDHPGKHAYKGASGIVREVAIDRWLNKADGEGLIESVDKKEIYKVRLTKLGELKVKHNQEWEKIKRENQCRE